MSGGIADKIDKALGALGLQVHGSNKGLIQIMLSAGKDITLLFWYAMKAMKGDKEAKAKAEEIAKKEVKKEDVIDFLLKLDTLSMHLLTGPIHMIDALTGWHIAPRIQKKSKDITHRVDRAIAHLEKIAIEVPKNVAKKVQQYISGLRKTFVLDGVPIK